MANFLGRVLRYVMDAAQYADAGASKASHRGSAGMFGDPLGAMAQRDAWGQGETMDVDAAMRLAVTSAWVYSDVSLIADRLASKSARPQVKQRQGEELKDLGNHDFERLLSHPNDLMTGSYLLRYSGWWHQLRGNAYVFISTAAPGRGEPEELWPLPANAVRPLPGTLRKSALTGGQVIDYEYTVAGRLYILPGENVVHFRTPNPFDWWQGLAPLSAAMMGIQLDYNQAKWARDFFGKENAVPTNIISLPADLSDDEFELAKLAIKAEHGEGRKSAIVRAGEMSIESVTQTLEQMQINASREFARKELDRVFKVPEGLMSAGLSGDSRLAAEIGFARNCVQPLLDYFADEWTAKLAPYYGEDIVIEAPDVVPQERSIAVQEMATYGQYRSVNENRGDLGLDKVADPRADIPLVLFTLPQPQTASVGEAPGAAPATNEPPDASEPTPEEAATVQEEANTAGNASMAGAPSPEDEVARQAQRSAELEGSNAAAAIALRAELDRWRRVALRETKAGRDPGTRAFESDVIPAVVALRLGTALAGADEVAVKAAFAEALKFNPNHDEAGRFAEGEGGGASQADGGRGGATPELDKQYPRLLKGMKRALGQANGVPVVNDLGVVYATTSQELAYRYAGEGDDGVLEFRYDAGANLADFTDPDVVERVLTEAFTDYVHDITQAAIWDDAWHENTQDPEWVRAVAEEIARAEPMADTANFGQLAAMDDPSIIAAVQRLGFDGGTDGVTYAITNPEVLHRLDMEAVVAKGGPGSGFYGHAGRPGAVGGSLPADVALSATTGRQRGVRQQVAVAGRRVDEANEAASAYLRQADEGSQEETTAAHDEYVRSLREATGAASQIADLDMRERAYEILAGDLLRMQERDLLTPELAAVQESLGKRMLETQLAQHEARTGVDEASPARVVREYGVGLFQTMTAIRTDDLGRMLANSFGKDRSVERGLAAGYIEESKPGLLRLTDKGEAVLAAYREGLGGKAVTTSGTGEAAVRVAFDGAQKGGAGSGHFGHAGRPGEVGGSLPADVALSAATGRDAPTRQFTAQQLGRMARIPVPPSIIPAHLEGAEADVRRAGEVRDRVLALAGRMEEFIGDPNEAGAHSRLAETFRDKPGLEVTSQQQHAQLVHLRTGRNAIAARTDPQYFLASEGRSAADWAHAMLVSGVNAVASEHDLVLMDRASSEHFWYVAEHVKTVHEGAAFLSVLKAATALVPDAFANCFKAGEDFLADAEDDLQAELEEVFLRFRKRFAAAIAEGKPLPWAELEAALDLVIHPAIVEVAVDGLLRASVVTGIAFDPAVVNNAALGWAREYSFGLIRGINETTRQTVSEAVQRWNSTAGMVRQDLEDLLAPTFGSARAESIAITEVTRAAAAGVNADQKLLAAEGLVFKRVWHTRNDELTCEAMCALLDGKIEDEPVPGHPDPVIADKGWGAGEKTKDGPPGHPRCRCFEGLAWVGGNQVQAPAEAGA